MDRVLISLLEKFSEGKEKMKNLTEKLNIVKLNPKIVKECKYGNFATTLINNQIDNLLSKNLCIQ